MTMIRSRVAARVLAALTQAGRAGARLRDIAAAIGARESSVQRALRSLQEDRLVEQVAVGRRKGYRTNDDHPAAEPAIGLALNQLAREETIAILARANSGIEFASISPDISPGQLTVVHSRSSTPGTRLAFREALAKLRGAPELDILEARHDELVDRLLDGPAPRERAGAGAIVKGTIARSFPDPHRHGDFLRARRLHRLHRDVPRPSQRALRRLARTFGLHDLAVFGSAVREDFRPDSDVDVVVRYAPAARHRLADIFGLEQELERLFDRDVNVVDERYLPERIRPYVEREEVTLLGRA